jgi:hypothetical protein
VTIPFSEVWGPPQSGRLECALCGERFFQDGCSIRLKDDHGQWLDICGKCADAGPAGAAARAIMRAIELREIAEKQLARLRRQAKECERLARLLATVSPWVTTADLETAYEEIRGGSLRSEALGQPRNQKPGPTND